MRSILGLSALAATGAGAFMIPPNGDIGTDGTFKIAVPDASKPLQTFGVDPYTQIVQLPCPGCAFAQFTDNGVSWIRDQENYLVLNFSVGANPQTLEMNGVQIYPPLLPNSVEPEVLQVPADMSLAEVQAHSRLASPAHSLRLTAWSLQAASIHSSGATGEEILNMHLQIHAMEQRPVRIPEVVVTAVKNQRSELLLLKTEASDKPLSPQKSQKECHNWPLLCKWRAIVAERLEAMQHKFKSACHKRPGFAMTKHGKKPHHGRPHHRPHGASEKPHHGKPHHRPHGASEKPHHGEPHHDRPHHHHHHHNPHQLMNKIARVLLTVVIPLLVGILAGMLTYLVGMVVGTGIALLWIKIRGRRQQYAAVALGDTDEEEGRESLEKGELVDEEYTEAPPIYVEVEGKEISPN